LNGCTIIPKQKRIPISFLDQVQDCCPNFSLEITLDLFLEKKKAMEVTSFTVDDTKSFGVLILLNLIQSPMLFFLLANVVV